MIRNRFFSKGFTLIEMVMTLVVIGIAVAAVMLTFQTAVRSSADPMIAQQMMSIAQSLSQEVALQPFASQTNVIASSGCARDAFNDVDDFNGYTTNNMICSPDGVAIDSLSRYSTAITVGAPQNLQGVPMKLITVIVSRGSESFSMSVYRADLS